MNNNTTTISYQKVNANYKYHRDSTIINLTENICTKMGSIYICGTQEYRTELLKNIAIQLINNGVEVTYASEIPMFNIVNNTTTNIKELVNILSNLHDEAINRFRVMEQQEVNHNSKLKEHAQPKALIINDFDRYMYSNDHTSVAIIEQLLKFFIEQCNSAADILIIFASELSSEKTLKLSRHCIYNNIIVSNTIDTDISMSMFDESIDLYIPNGFGIYQTTCHNYLNDTIKNQYTIFNINDVKNYKL